MFLFLDIDGVLVPAKSWISPEVLNDGFPAFYGKAVRVLQKIISNDTTVLLTTSHKSRFTISQWKEIFQKRGIQIAHLQCLPENTHQLSRVDEVMNWFHHHLMPDEFIIIDDDKSLNALPPHIKQRLILTSPLIGLTDAHLDEIHQALSFNKVLV
jgi:16S rRNA C1402 (ribose-2'-O) methylase RsmI